MTRNETYFKENLIPFPPKKEENESLDSLKMKDNNRPSNNVYNLSSRTESRIKDDLNIFTTEMEWAG